MPRRPLLMALLLGAFVALGAPSCLSPTIPLPPPEQPSTILAGADPGTWEVFGQCIPGSMVTVFNTHTGLGVVYEDRDRTGNYVVEIAGAQCDTAWVRQDDGAEESAPTSFVLAARKPGDPTDNPLCH